MGSITTVAELKKEALELNLSGDQISKYIFEQQKILRDERASNREIEKLKIETTEREKIRQHELAMIQASANSTPNASMSVHTNNLLMSKTKLPTLKDGDDISSYFVRFERICEMLNIPETSYAVTVGSLITGKTVDIYASLSADVTKNYDRLKSALLLAFNKTPDGYRHEFKSSRIRHDETFSQFYGILSRKLDYCINSIEIEHTFDALKDFVICDQIVSTMNPELRLYVKERAPSSTEELLHLADSWSSARKKFQNGNSPNRFATKEKSFVESEETRADAPASPNPKDTPPSPKSKSEVICHYCKRRGHYKSECLSRPITSSFSPGRVQFCWDKENRRKRKHMVEGKVNGAHVSTILLDTGCDCIIVSDKILPNIDRTICKEKTIFDYLGRQDRFPVVKCLINCKYFNGWTDVVVAPLKFTSVLMGTVTPPEPPNWKP